MSFVIIDLTFLVLFTLITIFFLYRNKRNLKRQGLLYLYHTSWGIKLIDKTAKKYEKLLRPLQYVILTCGYILMVSVVWIIVRLAYTYISSPTLAKQLRVPVLIPLVPYLPDLFKLDFLPPFYFTYWIIIIAVLAVPHEFAHGIIAKLNKISVRSTGFGFLGPFLAAFVDPDEKQMNKAKKFPQLAILAAGTFANVLLTIFFGIVIFLFFLLFFTPAGVYFNSYATIPIELSTVNFVNNQYIFSESEIPGLLDLSSQNLTKIIASNRTYFTPAAIIQDSLNKNLSFFYAYDNSPAFKANLRGAIHKIDGKIITSQDNLVKELLSKQPGQEVVIETISSGKTKTYNIVLGEFNNKPYLGIYSSVKVDLSKVKLGTISKLLIPFYKFIDPIKYNQLLHSTYYESVIGDLGIFIYNLLWWLVLINISVALMNMLPLGIFDGGRFFYLTIWGITGKKKFGEYAYKISTWFFLAILAAMMLKWVMIFF